MTTSVAGVCECGGAVIRDSNSISGEAGEWWWDYRCVQCGETFQSRDEFISCSTPATGVILTAT